MSTITNMMKIARLSASALIFLHLVCAFSSLAADIQGLVATGYDSRIDLKWTSAETRGTAGYNIYRSPDGREPFVKLNDQPHVPSVYSDFIGENDRTFYYRVAQIAKNAASSLQSPAADLIVSARSREMSDDELLTSVQEATFRYFWDFAHPVSGLARERNHSGDCVTTGGTGFGLMCIMVGAERGFVTREQAASRVLQMVTFLQEKADRFHGAWPHWLNGTTGKTIPFSVKNFDDGADLVETSFLMEGMLTVRQYFDRKNPVEQEIQRRITQLWREVEWDWFLQKPGSKKLYWHWSPNYGWKKNLAIGGQFNECMITYLLAIASPTHPIPPECYYEGWAASPQYASVRTNYGIKQYVGPPMGGPLFFTHYSFLGFDPRNKRDCFCDYFENNRNLSLIHRAYCTANPQGHKGYGPLSWGLTASDYPDGYTASSPTHDTGTIAPTAALSAMPYTPEASLATLKYYYHKLGTRLWGEFGFYDAFNLDRDWYAKSYIAIDQGPIVCMIENYRTGLCWRMFMANPEIAPMLKAIGWKTSAN
ncbi:MAG: glucoamylase family protein [Verrucomicrobiota bacterium]